MDIGRGVSGGVIVNIKYIKKTGMGYHKLNYKYFDKNYECIKCGTINNKKNLLCIHNGKDISGDKYCLKCIGGIKNIEKFIISEVILGKVLE